MYLSPPMSADGPVDGAEAGRDVVIVLAPSPAPTSSEKAVVAAKQPGAFPVVATALPVPAPAAPVPPEPAPPDTPKLPLGTDDGTPGIKRWLASPGELPQVAIPAPEEQAGLSRRAGTPGGIPTRAGQGGSGGEGGAPSAASPANTANPDTTANPAPAPAPEPAVAPVAEPAATESPASQSASAQPPLAKSVLDQPPGAAETPPSVKGLAPAAVSRAAATNAIGPTLLPLAEQPAPKPEADRAIGPMDVPERELEVGSERDGGKIGIDATVAADQSAATEQQRPPVPPATEPLPELPAPADIAPRPARNSLGPTGLTLDGRALRASTPLVMLPEVLVRPELVERPLDRQVPATQKSSQGAAAQRGGKQGEPGDGNASLAGDPGMQSDRDSDAFSTAVGEYRAGRVTAGQGLEIRPTRPKFGLLARTLAAPRPPRVEIVFGRDGVVKRATILRSSGYPTDIDQPILNAIYEWTASGKALRELPPVPSAEIRLNMTVYLR